jgi:shikimate 5-dehydrogenase
LIVATGSDVDGEAASAIAAIAAGADLVFDLSCRCPDTPVLAAARQAGVPGVGGLEMLCAQVRRQLYWWTNRETSLAVLERAAMEAWAAPPQNGSSAS